MSYSFTVQQQADIDTNKSEIAAKSATLVTADADYIALRDETTWVLKFGQRRQQRWSRDLIEGESETQWDRELVDRARFEQFFIDHSIAEYLKVDILALAQGGTDFQSYVADELNKKKLDGLKGQVTQLRKDILVAKKAIKTICEAAVSETL